MYQTHSDTSKAAYHSLDNKKTLADKVLRMVQDSTVNGITNGWIAQNMEAQTSTIGARLVELEEGGFIFKLKRTMENPSGKQAHPYVAMGYRCHFTLDEIESMKPRASNTSESVKNLLRDINATIDMGTPILPEGDLHKRIKARIF